MKGAFRGIQYSFYPIMIFYKKLHTTELFFTKVFQCFKHLIKYIPSYLQLISQMVKMCYVVIDINFSQPFYEIY